MTDMQTKIIRVDAEQPDDRLLEPAAQAIRNGELVAFPTETVYGLGANALNPAAVAGIFKVKGRPGDNPLIVHISSLDDLPVLVREIPPLATKLFRAFSPGPLTLILPKSPCVPDLVTAGLDTVAIRIPAHPVARRLIELAGVPIAAPSANRSGRPSPTRAWHVAADLAGRIPYIIEAGRSHYGLESTVVDVTGEIPVILRPGSISAGAIGEIAGDVAGPGSGQPAAPDAAPRSPGMKYRHYAPKARVIIADAEDPAGRCRQVSGLIAESLAADCRVGLFICRRTQAALTGIACGLVQDLDAGLAAPDSVQASERLIPVICYHEQPDAAAAGAELFDALRRLDRTGVDVIIAEGLPERGVGAAYMNRLRKAAGAGRQDAACLPADPSEDLP